VSTSKNVAIPAQSASPASSGHATADSIEEVQRQIERTRDELGATIDQLTAKVDIRARVRQRAAAISARMKAMRTAPNRAGDTTGNSSPGAKQVAIPTAVGAGVFVLGLVVARKVVSR